MCRRDDIGHRAPRRRERGAHLRFEAGVALRVVGIAREGPRRPPRVDPRARDDDPIDGSGVDTNAKMGRTRRRHLDAGSGVHRKTARDERCVVAEELARIRRRHVHRAADGEETPCHVVEVRGRQHEEGGAVDHAVAVETGGRHGAEGFAREGLPVDRDVGAQAQAAVFDALDAQSGLRLSREHHPTICGRPDERDADVIRRGQMRPQQAGFDRVQHQPLPEIGVGGEGAHLPRDAVELGEPPRLVRRPRSPRSSERLPAHVAADPRSCRRATHGRPKPDRDVVRASQQASAGGRLESARSPLPRPGAQLQVDEQSQPSPVRDLLRRRDDPAPV